MLKSYIVENIRKVGYDMLKEFGRFIASDPIMLGLSCAIVFLVFIFVLVLVFGGKKKSKDIEENVVDNTDSLLKSDLKSEPLKSTQEFTLNLNMDEVQNDLPIETFTPQPFEEQKSVEEVVESSVKEDVVPISVELNNELPFINEASDVPLEVPIVEDVTLPEINSTPGESNVEYNQPFSSVYVDSSVELPAMDGKKEESSSDDLDDIELPMLNTSKETSVLSSLEGEHYNIN